MEFQPKLLASVNASLRDPVSLVDGCVAVPDGPGLGIEVNEDALRPHLGGSYAEPQPEVAP